MNTGKKRTERNDEVKLQILHKVTMTRFSAPGSRSKKKSADSTKSYLLKENLLTMTKVRQKIKKATISY